MKMALDQIEFAFELVHHFFVSHDGDLISPRHDLQFRKKGFDVFQDSVVRPKQFYGVDSLDFDLSF